MYASQLAISLVVFKSFFLEGRVTDETKIMAQVRM